MQNVTKTEIAAALQILLAACQQDQMNEADKQMLELIKGHNITTVADLEDALIVDHDQQRMIRIVDEAGITYPSELVDALGYKEEVDRICSRSGSCDNLGDIDSMIRKVDSFDCDLDEIEDKLEMLEEYEVLGDVSEIEHIKNALEENDIDVEMLPIVGRWKQAYEAMDEAGLDIDEISDAAMSLQAFRDEIMTHSVLSSLVRDAQAAYDKLKELEANNGESSKRIEQTMTDLGLNNDQVIEWLVDYNSIREIVKATN